MDTQQTPLERAEVARFSDAARQSPISPAARVHGGAYIGQECTLTAEEVAAFARQAGMTAGTWVLEMGSGTGGPACFLAQLLGCRVLGSDISAVGHAPAEARAREAGWRSTTMSCGSRCRQRSTGASVRYGGFPIWKRLQVASQRYRPLACASVCRTSLPPRRCGSTFGSSPSTVSGARSSRRCGGLPAIRKGSNRLHLSQQLAAAGILGQVAYIAEKPGHVRDAAAAQEAARG